MPCIARTGLGIPERVSLSTNAIRFINRNNNDHESEQDQGQVIDLSPPTDEEQIYKLKKIDVMNKEKESAALDAAKDQGIRQFMDSEQPRQAPQPESAAPDSS